MQALVLAFTGALWWIARRDLAARVLPTVPPAPAADTTELEELCATLETLVTSLAQRVDAVEAAVSKNGPAAEPAPSRPAAEPAPSRPAAEPAPSRPAAEPAPSRPAENDAILHAEPAPDPRYAPVYALLDAGIFDPVEIARRTGLGRGEVELLLSLRGRHAQ